MSVAVVGSLNEDIVVPVDRLPGRGQTVVGGAVTLTPGGKGANQAAAAARLGSAVSMVGRVGGDPAGERQLAALTELGVDVSHVHRTPGVPTGTATIPVEQGSGENLIVVAPGANRRLAPADVDVEPVRRARVVLLQLEIPLPTVLAAAGAARGLVVLVPAPARRLPGSLLDRVGVLVPNEHELPVLAGADRPPGSLRELVGPARSLGPAVVVTLGGRGALVVAGREVLRQPPPPVVPVDTIGAGDCLAGALAHAMARGADLAEATRYAVAAASLSTTGHGARGRLPDDDAVRVLLPRLPPPERVC